MASSTLILNPSKILPFKRVAQLGFNTCHAPMVMRSDLQEHMRRAKHELGMRYWRCHGTLSDDIGLFSERDGKQVYTFSGLKRTLDIVLASGLKPFFELSFMPESLARDPSITLNHYRSLTSPPKSWKAWQDLIGALIHFLVKTYGKSELKKWYFEVWNEPNIAFWSGTREEYFLLYRHAVLAIKKACPDFKVGGPATARAEWVPEFLSFCRKTSTPVDFVSTHIYPSDVPFMESAKGSVQLLGTDFLRAHFKRVQEEVSAFNAALPIFWGEWNSSAGPFAENHDTCNNAALICSALAGIEDHGDGSMFWNLSDIYEECQYHFLPFHGGYGLYSVDNIPKSAARAFEFWNSLEGDRLDIHGLPETAARGALATRHSKSNILTVLFWNHLEEKQSATDWQVSFSAEDGVQKSATASWILPGQGSAYETWLAMKKPVNLTPAQLKKLQTASKPKTSILRQNSHQNFCFNLPPGAVCRLSFP